MRQISMSNTGLPLCTPGTHHSSGSKPQLAAGRPPRLAGWPREWCQRQEGSGRTSLRTAASGGQDPFSGRSPLFESEIFNKEMMEMSKEMTTLSSMVPKFSDFDLEGKKKFVDYMDRLVERLRIVMARIRLADDPLGNELLRQQNVQMLYASTSMDRMLEDMTRETKEMREVIALEERTADPQQLARAKQAWQQKFSGMANINVADLMSGSPDVMEGAMHPQAMKAAAEVMEDPSKTEQYRSVDPKLYAYLQALLGQRR